MEIKIGALYYNNPFTWKVGYIEISLGKNKHNAVSTSSKSPILRDESQHLRMYGDTLYLSERIVRG